MDREVALWFEEEGHRHSKPLLVTSLGADLYRLDEFPMLTEQASYGDVIEAKPLEDGSLYFRRVVEPGGFRTWSGLLPRKLTGSAAFAQLGQRVMQEGGFWQLDWEGWLRIALPPAAELDPDTALKQLDPAQDAREPAEPATPRATERAISLEISLHESPFDP